MGYDFQAIRDRHPLPEYLMQRGVQLRQSGSRWLAKCPLHAERNGEAFVIEGDRWTCFGKCDLSGDVVDFVEAIDGLTRNEALKSLGVAKVDYRPIRRSKKPRPVAPTPLTADQVAVKTKACSRLFNDKALQQWLADRRGWKRETIEALAVELSLGWLDSWDFETKDGDTYTVRNLLVFGYEFGIKVRYHRTGHPLDGGDDRRVRWLYGKPTLWRSQMDALKRSTSLILTEGESDTITLIDQGLSRGGCHVLALASASTWTQEWSRIFTNKRVLLATDADDAGRKALTKIGNAIYPNAQKVKYTNLDYV